MLLKPSVRYPHVLRTCHDDAQAGLVDVVLHTEVGCHSVDQHTVVRRHVGKLVGHLLPIFRKLDQVLLDFQQHRSVLLIAVDRLGDELLEIDTGAVGV